MCKFLKISISIFILQIVIIMRFMRKQHYFVSVDIWQLKAQHIGISVLIIFIVIRKTGNLAFLGSNNAAICGDVGKIFNFDHSALVFIFFYDLLKVEKKAFDQFTIFFVFLIRNFSFIGEIINSFEHFFFDLVMVQIRLFS